MVLNQVMFHKVLKNLKLENCNQLFLINFCLDFLMFGDVGNPEGTSLKIHEPLQKSTGENLRIGGRFVDKLSQLRYLDNLCLRAEASVT